MSENEKSKLELLKDEATKLGMTFHPAIGEAKLQEKIDEHYEAHPEDKPSNEIKGDDLEKPNLEDGDNMQLQDSPPIPKPKPKPVVHKTELQKKAERNKRIRTEANALVRVNVTCMNPNKRALTAEIFTVGNKVVGTVRKLIPFNTPEGFHVPRMILDVLEEKVCQIFVEHKLPGPGNKKTKKGKLIKEFNIQYLPKLDKEKLDDLAKRQALSGAIDQEV